MNTTHALVAIIVLAVIVLLVYYQLKGKDQGGGGTITSMDGNSVSFSCLAGTKVQIKRATYGPAQGRGAGCKTVDVTAAVQKIVDAGASTFIVPQGLGVTCGIAGGALTVTYTCAPAGDPSGALNKQTFVPQRVLPRSGCAEPGPDGRIASGGPFGGEDPRDFGADRGGDTVANNSPFSDTVTGMNIAVARGGLTSSSVPEDGPINPIIRAGLASRVWRWANPVNLTGSPCSFAPELYHEPAEYDTTDDGPMAAKYYQTPQYTLQVAGPRGGPYQGEHGWCPPPPQRHEGFSGSHPQAVPGNWVARHTSQSAPEDYSIDSNFVVDGDYETATLAASLLDQYNDVWPGVSEIDQHESLTSRRSAPPSYLVGHPGVGQGSVWRDPRFAPAGPNDYLTSPVYGSYQAHAAQHSHAGGPTFGSAMLPGDFRPGGKWNTQYVRGFGTEWHPSHGTPRPSPGSLADAWATAM